MKKIAGPAVKLLVFFTVTAVCAVIIVAALRTPVGGPLSFFAEAGPAVTAIWAPTSSYNSADDHPGIDSGNSLEALNDLWDYRWSSLDSDFGRALFRLGVEAGGGVAFRLGPVSARATLRYRYTDGMESWLALENLSLGIALAFE